MGGRPNVSQAVLPCVGLKRFQKPVKGDSVSAEVGLAHRDDPRATGLQIDQFQVAAKRRVRFPWVEYLDQVDFVLVVAKSIERPLKTARIKEVADQDRESAGTGSLRDGTRGRFQAGLFAGRVQGFQKTNEIQGLRLPA